MKCAICRSRIQETFLKKPIGTVVKDGKGKKFTVCSECQRKFPKKSDLLEKL